MIGKEQMSMIDRVKKIAMEMHKQQTPGMSPSAAIGHEIIVDSDMTRSVYDVKCSCGLWKAALSYDVVKDYSASLSIGEKNTLIADQFWTLVSQTQKKEIRLRMETLFEAFPEHVHCKRIVPAHLSSKWEGRHMAGSMAGLAWTCEDCDVCLSMTEGAVDDYRHKQDELNARARNDRDYEFLLQRIMKLDLAHADESIETAQGEVLDRLANDLGVERRRSSVRVETDMGLRDRVLRLESSKRPQVDIEAHRDLEARVTALEKLDRVTMSDSQALSRGPIVWSRGPTIQVQGDEDGDI